MNANAIQEKILSDARTSASDIMRDANEKAARLRDAAEKRMAAAHSRLMMQASEDAEAARLRMERMEELEERKRLYSMYAEKHGWKLELLNYNDTELGGVKEADFILNDAGAWSRLKFESGVHRVQRVPETESGGRVHTSTATVAVLPEMEEVDVDLRPEDIEMQVYRSSGAGGQHVNKTSSAVRLIHKPTGIVTACQTQRSQFQNRDYAMQMLKSKLMELKIQQHAEMISDIKGVQLKIEWGSQIRSYVFMPYQLVKDTRTDYETGNIQSVMDGDLDGFINAYLTKSANGELKK